MKVYTSSEARQHFARILDEAQRKGCVGIQRRDGQTFVLKPETPKTFPLDVPGLDLGLSADKIVAWVREGRER